MRRFVFYMCCRIPHREKYAYLCAVTFDCRLIVAHCRCEDSTTTDGARIEGPIVLTSSFTSFSNQVWRGVSPAVSLGFLFRALKVFAELELLVGASKLVAQPGSLLAELRCHLRG